MSAVIVSTSRPKLSLPRVVPCRAVVRPEPVGETAEARSTRELRFREVALVARLRAGDPMAFESLVRAYGPTMLAVARRYLPVQEDAEDALQSAFLLVFRFVHRFEGASRLSTWLHRIVVNCALMRLRTRQRHPEARLDMGAYESGAVSELVVRGTAYDESVTRESRDRVTAAVGRLPDLLRSAIRLHDLDGLTLDQTAHLLGRPRRSVDTSIQRGRVALRSMLAPAATSQDVA